MHVHKHHCLWLATFVAAPLLTLSLEEIRPRSEFCTSHYDIDQSGKPRALGLRGKNITVALTDEINHSNRYFAVRILDEIARRAKFHYTSFISGPPNEDEDWTDLLLRTAEKVDLVVGKWARSIERLDSGILYSEAFYDANALLVTKINPMDDEFVFWAFSKPFSPQLWGLILTTVFVTGFLFFILDALERQRQVDKDNMEPLLATLMNDIYKSFYSFTGGSVNFSPKSRACRVLTISMAFLYLILISAYTANLTNYYIIKSQPEIIIRNIDDVISKEFDICVPWAYASTEELKNIYGVRANLIETIPALGGETETEKYVMRDVSDGICQVGIVSGEAFETYKKNTEFNPGCDLELIGDKVLTMEGGFAVADSAELCPSFLLHVIDYHMIHMKKDGTFDQIMRDYRDAVSKSTCEAKKNSNEKYDPALKILNMAGIFAFHACLIVVSLLIGLYDYFSHPKHIRDELTSSFRESFGRTSSISIFNTNEGTFQPGNDKENRVCKGKQNEAKRFDKSHNLRNSDKKGDSQLIMREMITAMKTEKNDMMDLMKKQHNEMQRQSKEIEKQRKEIHQILRNVVDLHIRDGEI